MVSRIDLSGTPELCICIASRATSRQMPQPTPCGSHAVTRPCLSRPATKQSSLLRWPRLSQPQKHGTLLSTSGCSAAKVKTARTISGGRAGRKSVTGNGGRVEVELAGVDDGAGPVDTAGGTDGGGGDA